MKKSVLFVLFIFLCASVFGQDSTNALLKSVQLKYNSIKSFTVNFTKSSGSKEDFCIYGRRMFLYPDEYCILYSCMIF